MSRGAGRRTNHKPNKPNKHLPRVQPKSSSDEAARLFTQEFEALWASTMAPGAQGAEEGDSEMLQLFGHALEAVLRAQHKTPEANAIEARVAEAAAAGGR